MKDRIMIEGEEYIKKNSMGSLEEVFFDDLHIILHRKNIEVKGRICMCCGQEFSKEDIKKFLTKQHVIPVRFKPKFNIFIPLCDDCHQKIDNGMKKFHTKKTLKRMKRNNGEN